VSNFALKCSFLVLFISDILFEINFWCSLSKIGSLEEGNRIGLIAFALYKKFQAKAYLPRLSMFYYLGVHVRTKPVQLAIDPLEDAWLSGIETGDVEYAGICFNVHWTLRITTTNLRKLDGEMLEFSTRMEGQKTNLLISKPFWQAARNLMGLSSGDPEELNGDLFDAKQIEAARLVGGIFYGITCFPRMLLSFLFGDFDRAVTFAKETRALTRNHFSPFVPAMILTFEALSVVAHSRKIGRRRARRANEIAKLLRRLSSNAPHNFLVQYNLVTAEIAALKGDHATAFPCYFTAISMSHNEGLIAYSAVANELCGKYFLSRHDNESANTYLRDAIAAYTGWCATAKAQHLTKEMVSYGLESPPVEAHL